MKRFSIIILGALAILMAGCSKDAPVSPPDENAWINDINLPVPIQFGSSSLSAMTKAQDNPNPLGMIDGSTLNNVRVGILGIDSKADWNTGSNAISPSALLINNKEVTTKENGDIVFEPKEYYPMTSSQSYNFYGYYPYELKNNLKASAQPVLPGSEIGRQILFMNIDNIGYKDILWGGTKLQNKKFRYGENENGEPLYVEGYNAKYIRKVKQAEQWAQTTDELTPTERKDTLNALKEYFPKIQFKHCLSSARFYVKANDQAAENSFVDNFAVTGLTLENLYRTGVLIVALNNESNVDQSKYWEGKIVPVTNSVAPVVTPITTLTKSSGATLDPVVPTVDSQQLGDGLMLIPGDTSIGVKYFPYLKGTLHCEVYKRDNNGTIVEVKQESIAVDFPVEEEENFKAGKRYSFTVVLNELLEVDIRTSLEEWEDYIPSDSITGSGEGGVHIEIE